MQLPRVRFPLWAMMAAVAAIGLLMGLGIWWFAAPIIFVEPAPQPRSVSVDHEIYDVVLTDLLEYQEFDPATHGGGVKKTKIVLSDTSEGQLDDDFILHGFYAGQEKDVPSDVRRDLPRRNPERTRYSLTGYRPSNPSILLRDLSHSRGFEFGDEFPDARGYVVPHLPGYSEDGRTAVFLFSFGPTAHGAVGFYLLRKENGRWEIVLRHLGYFA